MNIKKLLGKNKDMSFNVMVGLVIAVALIAFLMNYNKVKSYNCAGMKNLSPYPVESDKIDPINPMNPINNDPHNKSTGVIGAGSDDTNDYLNVSGMSSTKPKVSSCNNEPVMNPKELLPSDSEWTDIAPSKGLENVSFLTAGHNMGTNTVGSSLRNANLQLRSEPANPRESVGPWNESTIEVDTMRKSLEIGGVFE